MPDGSGEAWCAVAAVTSEVRDRPRPILTWRRAPRPRSRSERARSDEDRMPKTPISRGPPFATRTEASSLCRKTRGQPPPRLVAVRVLDPELPLLLLPLLPALEEPVEERGADDPTDELGRDVDPVPSPTREPRE